ncbi:segregation/condensation protein A [Candidatus Aminicenantes bacterium AH-873-B07]|jgi:segregation and condensation protein A|nr:segregation/condensation protein A [Candidatus Aminicenantes bacterium AH-873-B07]
MEYYGYHVKLEFFEGPLELLLFLIKKNKIDIYDIPIARITREYLEYLDKKDKINLDHEADFLLVAATLIYIKSQMLLPKREKHYFEEDPRQNLVEQLIEYEKIKNISYYLYQKEEEQSVQWQKPVEKQTNMEYFLQETSLYDLALAFYSVLKRKERQEVKIIKGRKFSIEEKMKEIMDYLRKNKYLDFIEYFNKRRSLEEGLITFFSLLELLRLKKVIALQQGIFQKIEVWPYYYFKKLKGVAN